jgi:hypothetical protein
VSGLDLIADHTDTAAMLIGKTVALRPVEKGDLAVLTDWLNDPLFVDEPGTRWPIRPRELEKRMAKKPDYAKSGEFLIVLTHTLRGPEEVPVFIQSTANTATRPRPSDC